MYREIERERERESPLSMRGAVFEIHVNIYIYRERERDRERENPSCMRGVIFEFYVSENCIYIHMYIRI